MVLHAKLSGKHNNSCLYMDLPVHNRNRVKSSADEDPEETRINKTGCADANYTLQACMFEHRDWRKCQTEVKELQKCMDAYNQRQKRDLSTK